MTICEKFAKYIYEIKYEDLPKEVIEIAKERILDTVGALVAGYSSWTYSDAFIESIKEMGSGGYKAISSKTGEFPIAKVAFINSTFAHAVELDDGHKNAGCHAGAVVVPTALAMAQAYECTGKDILLSVVLGYEVVYHIATNMNPEQINKGFHPSSNCGVFGAMAVAGKLMSLSEAQISNGLGQAGMFASGTMEATISGQNAKCIQVGQAAYSGIQAATLAKNGIEGCLNALDGKFGLFSLQSENVNVQKIFKNIGNQYLIGDTYNKMYPTCRHAQPGIEAAMDLSREYGILPETVSAINIGTHEIAYNLTGKIKAPKDSGEAKFSLAYGAAVALTQHGFGVVHLTSEYFNNSEILKIASKVNCNIDADIQSVFPQKRGAKIEIILSNGQKYEKVLFDLKGSPNNSVGWKELADKFSMNTQNILSEINIENLLYDIKNLENIENTSSLYNLMY